MSATINETLHLPKTGNAIRLVIGVVLGVCITAGLFWFMQYLIVTADRELNEGGSTNLIDFVRLKRDESIQRRQHHLENDQVIGMVRHPTQRIIHVLNRIGAVSQIVQESAGGGGVGGRIPSLHPKEEPAQDAPRQKHRVGTLAC